MLIPIIVFFAATFLVFAVYQSQARKRQVMRARLAHYDMTIGVSSFPSLSSGLLRENRLSSIRAMDQMLGWGGWGDKMALDIARAAIPLRVGEYVLIRWLMALTLFIVGGFLGGSMVAGFLLAIGGYFFPRLYVSLCEKKRVKAFDDQLIDSLSLMANPSYIDMLFWTTVGRLMLAVAFGLEVVGFIICRKIMSIEV